MTLANKITMARIVIAPIFFALFQLVVQQIFHISAFLKIIVLFFLLLLFIGSEVSDLLDGIVARQMSQTSGVGKLMDPFSDVFSRITYFFCFYQIRLMPTYAFILILWREIAMLFVRQLVQLSGQGALPARWVGKVKAVIYCVATSLALLLFLFGHWPVSHALWDSQWLRRVTGAASARFDGICSFTLALDSQNISAFIYGILRAWLLPLSFFISVLASWYSFFLYLRDFLPTLRKMI